MYKASLNIGTLAGIISFAIFLILYAVGISPLSIGKFIGFWVPIVAVIWVNIHVREKTLGGAMTYLQAYLSGSVSILVWCTFKGFCMYIFMILFKQHVIDQYFQFTANYISFVENYTGASIQEKIDLKELRAGVTPWGLMMADISNNLIFGSIMTFIIAFFTKRTPKTPAI
jgi:hypothetical protein